MFLRHTILVAVITAVLSAGTARAGWVTFTNETNQVVVIHTDSFGKKPVRHGKPVRLMPGESVREFQLGACTKTVRVVDPKAPARPLFEGDVSWRADDQSFAVRASGASVQLTSSVAQPKPTVIRAAPPGK